MVRKPWFWLTLVAVVFLALLGLRAEATRRDVERWQAYQSMSRQAGDDLGVEAWLPPDVAETDNLMTHPWVAGFLSSESSAQSIALDSLQPWPGLALDGYLGPEEGRSWFEGRESESERVRHAALTYEADLAAIHEAAGRPGCRLPVDFSRPFELDDKSWLRVDQIRHALSVQADAEVAHGDGEAASRHLAALFRWGDHLRGQDFLLASVVGAGFESDAIAIARAGVVRKAFSPAERKRLLVAMRARPAENELLQVMKVERGWFLMTLDEAVAAAPAGLLSFNAWLHPAERLRATNALHFCHALDSVRPPTRPAWMRFHEAFGKPVPDRRHGIAATSLQISAGTVPAFFLLEDDLRELQEMLAE